MMILLLSNPSEDVYANRTVNRRYIMRIVTLLTVVSLALALSLARADDDTLVKFDGGIGVDPVANAQGMAATANVVIRNIVRGVQPAQRWVIAELKAEVKDDGRITVDGRGLVFAAGDTIGTALVLTPTGGAAASLMVFATLICENVAPFVDRNTNPVPLAANGDFKIDDVLSPPPPPASCATPVLLIRNAPSGIWFAAGIWKFDGGHFAE
jgi:hypothetical protein